MPSRRAIALILALWVATTSYIVYRDLWPRLFASGPPPVAIDIADEAAQNVPVRWAITRNGEKVGRLVTQMRYIEANDTFQFTSEYKQFRFAAGNVVVLVPKLTTVVGFTRSGDLREQSIDGTLELFWGESKIGDAALKLTGTVTDHQLIATCDMQSSFGNLHKSLDPVPVTRGQPLNPLQPVNRIADLKPGRRWVVHESNPLEDSLAALLRENAAGVGLKLPENKREELIGEVLSSPRDLEWREDLVACWVIEYRRDSELVARTWVRVADGKVLKQEAFKQGEHIAFERVE